MKKRRLTAMLLCLCMTASTITPVLANEESADTEISLLTESPTEEIGGEFGDGLRWDFDADTGLLTISGTGTMPRNWNDAFDAPWYSYASQIKNLVIEEGVSSIAPYAFAEFYNAITTVELPSTLTSVHYTSFKGNSLQSFNIENGSNFYTDDGVLFFQKNDEITLLFYPCHKNEDTYTVPEGTTHINSYAFNFVNLDEIYLPDSLQIIYDYAFMGSIIPVINIPAGVQSIDMPCFEDNMIQNFEVDEKNSYYTAVDGVLYTKDMQQLIAYPTMNTNETFTIPEGITAFPEYIITMAHQIKNLYIPSSVQEIVYTASDLMGSSLKNVFVDNDNQYYSDIDGVLFNKDMTELICYPASKDGTEYIIPESTTTILEDAFCDADNLESVIFHENISSIEGMGFYSCSNMTGAYFYGDVPETFGWGTYPPPFASVPSTFVIYYLDGVGEWTSPTYRGYNTEIFVPEINNNYPAPVLSIDSQDGEKVVFIWNYCEGAVEYEFSVTYPSGETSCYTIPATDNPNTSYTFGTTFVSDWTYCVYAIYEDGTRVASNIVDFSNTTSSITTTFDTTEITLREGETFTFEGFVSTTAASGLDDIQINIYNAATGVGIKYDRRDDIGTQEFDLSAFPSFDAGTTLTGEDELGETQNLELTAGTDWNVQIFATDNNGHSIGANVIKRINIVEKDIVIDNTALINNTFVQDLNITEVKNPYITFTDETHGVFQYVGESGSAYKRFVYSVSGNTVTLMHNREDITSDLTFGGIATELTFEITNTGDIKLISYKPEEYEGHEYDIGYTSLNTVFKKEIQPNVSGLQNNYTVTAGDTLDLTFTVTAGGSGLIKNITLMNSTTGEKCGESVVDAFEPSVTVERTITLSNTGTYNFTVYASADNYTVTDNNVATFTVTVKEKTDVDEPQSLIERTKYVIVCNEHNTDYKYDGSDYNYGSVTINDNGASAIGLFQWRESRTFDLLNAIVNCDLITQDEVKEILGTGKLYDDIVNGNRNDWSKRKLTSEEAEKVKTLLLTPAGINEQMYMAQKNAEEYCADAVDCGITQEAAKIVYADARNIGKGHADEIAESAVAKVGGDGSKVTWELLLEEYASHEKLSASGYKQRRDRLERLLTEWYGSSTDEPPVVEPVVNPSPILSMNCAFDNANPMLGETVNLKVSGKSSVDFSKIMVQWHNSNGVSQTINSKKISGKEISMTVPVDTNIFGKGKYQVYLFTEGNYCDFREVDLNIITPPSSDVPSVDVNYKVYINGVEVNGTYKNPSNQLLTVEVDGISSTATYAGLQFINLNDTTQVKEFGAVKDKNGFKFYVKTFEIPEGRYKVLMYSGTPTQVLESATILDSVEIVDYNEKWSGYDYTINYDFINDKKGSYQGTSSTDRTINEFVNKKINEWLQNDRVLRNLFYTNEYGYSRSIVLMFEGAGSDLSISRRMAAMCVVLKNINGEPNVVYVNRNCTTIPDYVKNENGANGDKSCPIIKDGIWSISTRNHSHSMTKTKRYAALNIGDSGNALRFYGNNLKEDTVTGVNIHARSTNERAPLTFASGQKPWANSTGCFNIGKTNNQQAEYDNFINIITGVSGAKPNGTKFETTPKICSQCGTIEQDHGVVARMDMGVVIVNRELYATQLGQMYGSVENPDIISANKILGK